MYIYILFFIIWTHPDTQNHLDGWLVGCYLPSHPLHIHFIKMYVYVLVFLLPRKWLSGRWTRQLTVASPQFYPVVVKSDVWPFRLSKFFIKLDAETRWEFWHFVIFILIYIKKNNNKNELDAFSEPNSVPPSSRKYHHIPLINLMAGWCLLLFSSSHVI